MAHNTFAWVEIPVSDMNRAKKYYETVLNVELQLVDFGGVQMAWFPNAENPERTPGATGTLIKQESYIPSKEGTLVYIHCEDVQNELDRVEAAGGTIYQPKTQISPEHGYMGVMIDSEGNRVALHSVK
jgi:predicted enzyme related to lactoylglutathione lyase